MKRTKIITSIISAVWCLIFVFNSTAIAVESDQNFMKVDSISINDRCGIIVGKSVQLTATLMPESAPKSAVEWSSSNPSVIECTSDGYITGKTANSYADITCKAKWDDAKSVIRIYCVESIGEYKITNFKDVITFIYAQPSFGKLSSISLNTNAILRYLADMITIITETWPNSNTVKNAFEFSDHVCQMRGRYGSYVYVAVGTQSGGKDGFVKYSKLKEITKDFLKLSVTDMDVWGDGATYTSKKLSAIYEGKVDKWTVADESIATYDKTTNQVVCHKPGTTTITASADGMTATCTIHSLYKWPLAWTGKTNKVTNIYKAKGYEYSSSETISAEKEFIVYGDTGESDGWAYRNVKGTNTWGYIPIKDISTKGTISQYNLMNFRWPVNDINIRKISSPFGPRSSANGGNHKGFDIVSNNAGEVEGKSVVASYNGTIKKIYIDNNKNTSHGNSIVIATNKTDPISGKKLAIIYMHLSRWETNSSGNIVVNGKVLKEGDFVTKEQIIGAAGNTGKNTSGAHLHFEVNNQNAAIRSSDNNPFTETINPIYFYMDMDESITKSDTCEAASNGNGFYWYGENE